MRYFLLVKGRHNVHRKLLSCCIQCVASPTCHSFRYSSAYGTCLVQGDALDQSSSTGFKTFSMKQFQEHNQRIVQYSAHYSDYSRHNKTVDITDKSDEASNNSSQKTEVKFTRESNFKHRKEEPLKLKANDIESFLMISNKGPDDRDVYKVSMKSNMTQKTGITVSETVSSIVYDRTSNTLFWSQSNGLFKQGVAAKSKRKRTSKAVAHSLNLCNGTLFYCRNNGGHGYIYTHSPTRIDSSNLWLNMRDVQIFSLVVDGNIACWVKKSTVSRLCCVEMHSKTNIFSKQAVANFEELTLIKKANFKLLVLIEKFLIHHND